jgi:hypothetical protein
VGAGSTYLTFDGSGDYEGRIGVRVTTESEVKKDGRDHGDHHRD